MLSLYKTFRVPSPSLAPKPPYNFPCDCAVIQKHIAKIGRHQTVTKRNSWIVKSLHNIQLYYILTIRNEGVYGSGARFVVLDLLLLIINFFFIFTNLRILIIAKYRVDEVLVRLTCSSTSKNKGNSMDLADMLATPRMHGTKKWTQGTLENPIVRTYC